MKTDSTARSYLESGNNWTSQIAPLALPILLWVAKKGLTITYKQLALELRARHKEEIKHRMTVYGWPAGRIGHAINMLSDEWGQDIPPLNAIVVNAQTKLPGHGANSFIKRYLNQHAQRRLTDTNRDALAEEVLESVRDYPDWDRVASYFGINQLKPVSVLIDQKQDDEPIVFPPAAKQRGGYEESKEHKNLKLWAAQHPKFFSVLGKFNIGQNEYDLRSGDRLDAYLANNDTCLAIEVKASNAPESEIFRGIFQCIKYRATLRAMQLAEGEPTNAQAVLLVTRPVPTEAQRLAKRLRVTILAAPKEAEFY
jgi:hypothetical protein